MESSDAPTPFLIQKNQFKIIESKKYELKYENEEFSLLMEIYSDDNIYFKLRKSKNLSLYEYSNKHNYNEITKLFLLQKEHYKDLSKIFHFFDLAFTRKKIKLEYNKEKNVMLLKLNKILDFDEIECKLELNENKIQKDEMFNLLIDEINEIKNNKAGNKDNTDIVNELIKKNQEYENRIKILEDKINLTQSKNISFKGLSEKVKENLVNQADDTHLNMANLCEYIKEFDSIGKYFLGEKNKYLMITSERNQGNDILKYLLNKTNKKYFELIQSKFEDDLKNKEYYVEILDYIKNIMKNNNLLFLKDFDNSLYDIFSGKFSYFGNKKYLESNFKSEKIFAEINNEFGVIIIENNKEKSELFKDKFEKQLIKFNMFLEEKDFNIIDDILKYLD